MKYVLCWTVSFQSSDWSCLVDEELLYQRNDDTPFYVLGAIIFVLVLLVVVLCVLLCHPKYPFITSSHHFSSSSNLCEPLMFHRSYFSQPKIRLDPRGTWSNMSQSWTFSPPLLLPSIPPVFKSRTWQQPPAPLSPSPPLLMPILFLLSSHPLWQSPAADYLACNLVSDLLAISCSFSPYQSWSKSLLQCVAYILGQDIANNFWPG